MIRSLWLATAVSVAFSAIPSNAAVFIDDFTAPPNGQRAVDASQSGGSVWNSLSGQPVLGGSREIAVNKTSQIGVGDQPVTASANDLETSIFNFDQFSSTARGIGRLIYDGNANGALDPTGLPSGIDLTQGGANHGFLFEDVKVTGSGLMLTVNLYNKLTGDVFSSGPQLLINGFNGIVFLRYADFSGAGGMDTLTNLGALEIVIDGSADAASGSDMTFAIASAAPTPVPTPVPEPSTLVLAGLGSLLTCGFGMRRRRRDASAAV